ncbi:MAG: hypothetical protein FLDDKLPJ_02020 [Phycisphaerae bacterium]|nr:hypothetical protein [Phycisphaerae bacterium]
MPRGIIRKFETLLQNRAAAVRKRAFRAFHAGFETASQPRKGRWKTTRHASAGEPARRKRSPGGTEEAPQARRPAAPRPTDPPRRRSTDAMRRRLTSAMRRRSAVSPGLRNPMSDESPGDSGMLLRSTPRGASRACTEAPSQRQGAPRRILKMLRTGVRGRLRRTLPDGRGSVLKQRLDRDHDSGGTRPRAGRGGGAPPGRPDVARKEMLI